MRGAVCSGRCRYGSASEQSSAHLKNVLHWQCCIGFKGHACLCWGKPNALYSPTSMHLLWLNLAIHTHTHTYTRLTALCPGLPGWTGKVKPIWNLLKQETVSGSGISWATCKSAPSSRQITTPAPHHSIFTGRMPFLPPNQQRQSTEMKPQNV